MHAQLINFSRVSPSSRTRSGLCSPLCLTRTRTRTHTCTLLLLLLLLLPSCFTLHAPRSSNARVHCGVSAESRRGRCTAPCAARAVTGDESATRTRFALTPTFPFVQLPPLCDKLLPSCSSAPHSAPFLAPSRLVYVLPTSLTPRHFLLRLPQPSRVLL